MSATMPLVQHGTEQRTLACRALSRKLVVTSYSIQDNALDAHIGQTIRNLAQGCRELWMSDFEV